MRLFVGLELDERARARLRELVAPVSGDHRMTWARPDGWHLTLVFLGEVDDDRVTEVVDAVQRGVGTWRQGRGVTAIGLTAAGTTVLGRGALAVELADEPSGAVGALAADVRARLVADLGWELSDRQVRPHVTVARARRGRVPAAVRPDVPPGELAWSVDRVVVFRSVLGRGPARYEVVATVPFAG